MPLVTKSVPGAFWMHFNQKFLLSRRYHCRWSANNWYNIRQSRVLHPLVFWHVFSQYSQSLLFLRPGPWNSKRQAVRPLQMYGPEAHLRWCGQQHEIREYFLHGTTSHCRLQIRRSASRSAGYSFRHKYDIRHWKDSAVVCFWSLLFLGEFAAHITGMNQLFLDLCKILLTECDIQSSADGFQVCDVFFCFFGQRG